MTGISAQMKPEAMEMQGHSPGVVLRSLVIGLTAFLTVVDLFATQAILPSLTRHYNVTPAAMGFAVNASTMGMAVAGLVVGFLSPHIDRRLGILAEPGPARDPHRAAGERPRSHRVHDPAHRAGPLHGLGLCADAGLSRRAMQFDGCRWRVRRLYHRQRRQQSDRAAGVGRGRRYARAGLELLFLRAAQSCRRGAGLLHHPARQADARDAHGAIAVRCHDRALAQPGAALGLRHRLLHPVCLYRHLHLRQFRAGARAAVARADGSRLCLFRVRALRRHDAVRRQGGGALRHAAGDLGRARGRRFGPAADAVFASARSSDRHGAGRRRHVLRTGLRHRLCRAGRQRQPRHCQRNLSCLLFSRWPRRQRRAGPVVRPLRMDRLRRRRRRVAGHRGAIDRAPQLTQPAGSPA